MGSGQQHLGTVVGSPRRRANERMFTRTTEHDAAELASLQHKNGGYYTGAGWHRPPYLRHQFPFFGADFAALIFRAIKSMDSRDMYPMGTAPSRNASSRLLSVTS